MNSSRLKAALVLAVLALMSCSQPPQPSGEAKTATPAKETAVPAGPVTGKTALWELVKPAHNWAKDMTPLALASKSVPGVKNEAGKASVWTATFGSPSKHEARIFTFSVVDHAPDISKGVSIGHAIPWSGPKSDAMPFEATNAELAVDSDAAYQAAAAQAAKWLKQHPGMEPAISLGSATRFPTAVWYVHWGDKKSEYALYVNAKTGAVEK